MTPFVNASSTLATVRLVLARLVIAAAVVISRVVAAESPAGAPPAPKVTVASVEQKFLADYEEITGRVDATETVELRARVSGHLDAVNFQAGQLVHKGDVLFTIDPRWYQAQFARARARA